MTDAALFVLEPVAAAVAAFGGLPGVSLFFSPLQLIPVAAAAENRGGAEHRKGVCLHPACTGAAAGISCCANADERGGEDCDHAGMGFGGCDTDDADVGDVRVRNRKMRMTRRESDPERLVLSTSFDFPVSTRRL